MEGIDATEEKRREKIEKREESSGAEKTVVVNCG